MILHNIDKDNKFMSIFDTMSGAYVRTGVLDEKGKDTGVDPFMASFPELLDIGIMGHCIHREKGYCYKYGIECYQDGLNTVRDNMTLDNFKRIIDECKGKTYQVALGGRGDPNYHENFGDILKYCQENNIVPNYTTSGIMLTPEAVKLSKEYCGAVAVSWHNFSYTHSALDMLIKAGVKTNIHYVLNNKTIQDACLRLSLGGDFHQGINAVVFLMHKPVGLGTDANVLHMDDDRVKRFFDYIDKGNFPFKIGFDSCSVPGLLNLSTSIDRQSIDTCEGARWSAYISSDMKMMPCSFDNQEENWAYDISEDTIENAWNSPQFEDFRNYFRHSCPGCKDREACMGGCPIRNQIVLCDRAGRFQSNEVTLEEV